MKKRDKHHMQIICNRFHYICDNLDRNNARMFAWVNDRPYNGNNRTELRRRVWIRRLNSIEKYINKRGKHIRWYK